MVFFNLQITDISNSFMDLKSMLEIPYLCLNTIFGENIKERNAVVSISHNLDTIRWNDSLVAATIRKKS